MLRSADDRGRKYDEQTVAHQFEDVAAMLVNGGNNRIGIRARAPELCRAQLLAHKTAEDCGFASARQSRLCNPDREIGKFVVVHPPGSITRANRWVKQRLIGDLKKK